jgi:hypothetical protein
MDADNAVPITPEWLESLGFIQVRTPGPGWRIVTEANQWLDWRFAGFWIGETPIARAETREQVRKLLDAIGVQP